MTEMNIATILTLAVLLAAGGCIREKGAASEKVIRFEPTRESLSQWEVPRWFEDAVLGVYVHWGPYSVPGFVFKDSSERVDSGIWYGWEMEVGRHDRTTEAALAKGCADRKLLGVQDPGS